MLPLAVNLVALVLVLGMCWAAMMWLGGRSHGQRGELRRQANGEPMWFDAAPKTKSTDRVINLSTSAPCAECEGVGALQARGKLAPCPECFGTGVLSA